MTAQGPTTGRIKSLDGLRAVAILSVIVAHLGNDLGWGDPLDLGEMGVRVFFVISGFLITSILLEELQRDATINLPRFYFRRTLRIMPAYYVYIGVMLIAGLLGYNALTLKAAVPALTYTSNYWRATSSQWYHTIAHTWSLSTEEQFYLVWPAILLLAGRAGARTVLFAVVAGAPVVRSILYLRGHSLAARAFQFAFDQIGTGCLLAYLRESLHDSAIYRRLLGSPLTPIALLLPVEWLDMSLQHPSIRDTIGSTVSNVGIAVCIDWAVTNSETSVAGRVLNHRWLTFIGVLSYSIYLWQQPFLYLHSKTRITLFLSGAGMILKNPAAAVLAIAACATVSYFFVERPWLRLRERWEPSLFPRAARAHSPAERLNASVLESRIAPPNEAESLV